MDCKKIAEVLSDTFIKGKVDALAPLLADDCEYISEPGEKILHGSDSVIKSIKSVRELNQKDEVNLGYTCNIEELASLLNTGVSISDLPAPPNSSICNYALVLRRHNESGVNSVCYFALNNEGKVKYIRLSRDKSKFDSDFYGDDLNYDSVEDVPATVRPYDTYDFLHSDDIGARRARNPIGKDNLYIWRKANDFAIDWLSQKGFQIQTSKIFDDCIGYRCERKGVAYTVFMYAYGRNKRSVIDGEHCMHLQELEFAKDSIVLVLGLNVRRYRDGEEIKYDVRNYYGNADSRPEFWHPTKIDGKPVLLYYPSKEMMDGLWQFMYAFNRENTDIYDCIIADENPSIEGDPNAPGSFLNDAFYFRLLDLHRKYGDMKMGYMCRDDTLYCKLPYLEDLGYFSWNQYENDNRMQNFTIHPFDEPDYKEFIQSGRREPDNLFDFIPKLIGAEPLPPQPTERFAVKLYFDTGECKKYVLPISEEDDKADVIQYGDYVFTDAIWNSASVVQTHKSRQNLGWSDLTYPDGGQAVTFKNGFYIAGTRGYLDGEPYSEPVLTDEIVFEDDKFRVRKIWEWDGYWLYSDFDKLNSNMLKGMVLQDFNYRPTFITIDGRRSSLTYDDIEDSNEGLIKVFSHTLGYGFVDNKLNLVIPMQYEDADIFMDGVAWVKKDSVWFYIDKNGNKLESLSKVNRYKLHGQFSEGLCGVSTLNLEDKLACYSDYESSAGVWGYVNEAGDEVIKPQYIYAFDFEDGMAIVAKGEWTIDPKWDNEYNKGLYWTDTELWGAIDKHGNEVIPFIFDEIKPFYERKDMFFVHTGGWQEGCWGVIDRAGNTIVPPIFKDTGYNYDDGLFIFKNDKYLEGIYDIKTKKVVFEPQFKEINFVVFDNGNLVVEVFSEKQNKNYVTIIDRDGKEIEKLPYSSIYAWYGYYIVTKTENSIQKDGIMDMGGNIIVPCEYDIPYGGIYPAAKIFKYIENGKEGVMDFNENVIIRPLYSAIYDLSRPLWIVRTSNDSEEKYGIITPEGKTVLPTEFTKIDWCSDKKHFYACGENGCAMYVSEDVEP